MIYEGTVGVHRTFNGKQRFSMCFLPLMRMAALAIRGAFRELGELAGFLETLKLNEDRLQDFTGDLYRTIGLDSSM